MLLLLRVTITVLALGVLLHLYEARAVARLVANVGAGAFGSAIALYVLCIFIGAWKWQIVVRDVPYATLLGAVLASCFYSILPSGQLGGELSKILIVKAKHPHVNGVFASVLFDKLTGVLSLLLLGVAAIALSGTEVKAWQFLLVGGLTFGSAAFLLLAPNAVTILRGLNFKASLLCRVQNTLLNALTKICQHSRNRQLLVESIVLGLLSQGTIVATYLVIAVALKIEVNPIDLVSVVVLANLAALLPISIGGFGVREVGLTVLLTQNYNVPGEQALALSLAVMTVFLLAALVGGIVELRVLATRKANR